MRKSVSFTAVIIILFLLAIILAIVLWTYPSSVSINPSTKTSIDLGSQTTAENGEKSKDDDSLKNRQSNQEPEEGEADNGEYNDGSPEKQIDTSRIGIAGISLGDSRDKVREILGDEYEETFQEEGGYFGESYYTWDYNKKGISFIIGKDSEKVLEIELTGGELSTNMGDNVGDTAKKVLEKYRAKFKEPISIHTDEKLAGWFDLGDTLLLIFDFDKDDGTPVNNNIQPDSKVEMIKLTSSMFMD